MAYYGLDVGTSFIVLASEKDNNVEYKDFRDAFYIIKPSTPIANKMIEKGLEGKIFIKDADNSFILLGKDAIDKAIERNDNARRPMKKGVISASEKESRKILSFILKEVVGKASPEDKLVFCVPAQPVDVEDDNFDIGYHEDVVSSVLKECGYNVKVINEAEAICYAELENANYTGISVSAGSGMQNICVMLNGEVVVKFSSTKSGDYIDRMVSLATGEKDTIVQAEKEHGIYEIGKSNDNPILEAVSAYYERLIDYTTKQICAHLTNHKLLPKFKDPLKIVVAGGTSLANGYVQIFLQKLVENNFPLPIKEVVHAEDPLHAVAKGCPIASQVL